MSIAGGEHLIVWGIQSDVGRGKAAEEAREAVRLATNVSIAVHAHTIVQHQPWSGAPFILGVETIVIAGYGNVLRLVEGLLEVRPRRSRQHAAGEVSHGVESIVAPIGIHGGIAVGHVVTFEVDAE